jgi:hypothetical protein
VRRLLTFLLLLLVVWTAVALYFMYTFETRVEASTPRYDVNCLRYEKHHHVPLAKRRYRCRVHTAVISSGGGAKGKTTAQPGFMAWDVGNFMWRVVFRVDFMALDLGFFGWQYAITGMDCHLDHAFMFDVTMGACQSAKEASATRVGGNWIIKAGVCPYCVNQGFTSRFWLNNDGTTRGPVTGT